MLRAIRALPDTALGIANRRTYKSYADYLLANPDILILHNEIAVELAAYRDALLSPRPVGNPLAMIPQDTDMAGAVHQLPLAPTLPAPELPDQFHPSFIGPLDEIGTDMRQIITGLPDIPASNNGLRDQHVMHYFTLHGPNAVLRDGLLHAVPLLAHLTSPADDEPPALFGDPDEDPHYYDDMPDLATESSNFSDGPPDMPSPDPSAAEAPLPSTNMHLTELEYDAMSTESPVTTLGHIDSSYDYDDEYPDPTDYDA